MPCRQHKTLLKRAPPWQQTTRSSYFPTFTRAIPAFRNFSTPARDIVCVLRDPRCSLLQAFSRWERRGILEQAEALEKIDIRALAVTNFSEIPAFIDTVVSDCGRIDVLGNNARLCDGRVRRKNIRLEELRLQRVALAAPIRGA